MTSIIIVTSRNNIALTKLAIRGALAQDPPVDVMLADNASTDGTIAWAATKPIARISHQKQLSLAAVWNHALRAAWKAGYNSALMLNNDTEIRADSVRLLSEHGGEFVTCVSVDEAGRMGVAGDRTIEDLRITERPHPDFSAFFIRRSVTDRGLWFDEGMYPAYCEDSDYHIRLHRAGVIALCIDLPFLHHGASTLKDASPRDSVVIRRGADQNRIRFKNKYGCLPGSEGYEKLFLGAE
jgi:GT2 family glycosyltransferase